MRAPISRSGRSFSPSCLILALLAAILAHLGALRPHLVAKLLQDGAQMAQHSAKMGQHGLQEGPQIQEKPSKVMNYRRFFGFRPFWQDRAQDTKKVTKMLPKARQVGSKFASLGTSWRQVGQHSVILAPTWPILVPRCAPTGIHMEPQMPPNSHLAPSWRQEGPQSAPRQPQGSIFSYFPPFLGTILDRFPFIFHIPLNRISKSILPSMFDFLLQFLLSISSSQVSSLGTVAVWRAQRIGIFIQVKKRNEHNSNVIRSSYNKNNLQVSGEIRATMV